MSLKQKIQDDLTAALKAKDETRVGTLRLVKSEIMKYEVSGSQKTEADDEAVQAILAKEAKKRKEAIEAFEKGGRAEQAAQERAELEILETYLPKQLSDEELEKVVGEVAAQVGANGPQDFGKVMGAVMGRVKGQADGNRVSAAVKKKLS